MKTTANNSTCKRDEKKQINIKWNSPLFFQIGIITSLMLVFFIMQTKFETQVARSIQLTSPNFEEPPFIDYVIERDNPKPLAPQKPKTVKTIPKIKAITNTEFTVKPNTTPEAESTIPAMDTPVGDGTVSQTEMPAPPENTGPKNMLNVEFVPTYPGCETLGTNSEKVACMSERINSFINKNFRKDILEDLKAQTTYNVYVNFKIDSHGNVTEVRAISNSEKLKKEAQRVIANLPIMKPGKQGDKNVDVFYTVPIAFQIK